MSTRTHRPLWRKCPDVRPSSRCDIARYRPADTRPKLIPIDLASPPCPAPSSTRCIIRSSRRSTGRHSMRVCQRLMPKSAYQESGHLGLDFAVSSQARTVQPLMRYLATRCRRTASSDARSWMGRTLVRRGIGRRFWRPCQQQRQVLPLTDDAAGPCVRLAGQLVAVSLRNEQSLLAPLSNTCPRHSATGSHRHHAQCRFSGQPRY